MTDKIGNINKNRTKIETSQEIQNKIKTLSVIREEKVYKKDDPTEIAKKAKNIDIAKTSRELIRWISRNVENFINNQRTSFKLDLIMDDESETIEDMEEMRKLQDLYTSLPDPSVKDLEDLATIDTKQIEKARKILDGVTKKVQDQCKNEKESMDNLFKRMAYYYELKGISKGKLLIQELEGQVSIVNFEYEAFSVGVKVRNPKEDQTLREYVIPEGFTVWIEIVCNPANPPMSMF